MSKNLLIDMHPRMRRNTGILGILTILIAPLAILGGIKLILSNDQLQSIDLLTSPSHYNSGFLVGFSIFFFVIGAIFLSSGLYLLNKPFHRIRLFNEKILLQRTLHSREVAISDISKLSLFITTVAFDSDLNVNHYRSLKIIIETEKREFHLLIQYVIQKQIRDAIDFFKENLGSDPFYETIEHSEHMIPAVGSHSIERDKHVKRYVWTIRN